MIVRIKYRIRNRPLLSSKTSSAWKFKLILLEITKLGVIVIRKRSGKELISTDFFSLLLFKICRPTHGCRFERN